VQGACHLILGWSIGEAAGLPTARLRRLVGLSGLMCDIDSLAYAGAMVFYGFDLDRASEVHGAIHHKYTHGVGFVVAMAAMMAAYVLLRGPGTRADGVPAPKRWLGALAVGGLSLVAGVVHLFSDLIGSGRDWPLSPYWPFSDATWVLHWSWRLDEWPNFVLFWILLVGVLLYGRYAGRSPIECIHYGLDRRIIRALQTGKS
jgi:hypothetical protein